MLVLPNGDLVVGGAFTTADAAVVNSVARWNGSTWTPLGAGVLGINNAPASVNALARLSNGDIVAAGSFMLAGGAAAVNIARWNGITWAPLGSGLNGAIHSLLVQPNGDLVAGGAFTQAGGLVTGVVARWNGTSWSGLGSGPGSGEATALALMSNGDLLAAGTFFGGSGNRPLQRWDGTQWLPILGLDPTFPLLTNVGVRANGHVVVAGTMSLNGTSQSMVVWDGTTFLPISPPQTARSLLVAGNGDVWTGANIVNQMILQRWDGATWQTFTGAPVRINALAEDASGRIVVGSDPMTSPRERAVTRFDGTNWQTLGGPKPPDVRTQLRMRNGDIVVGGAFTSFGGVAANNLARWNGSTWSPLGSGVSGTVQSLAEAPNGDLIVGGSITAAGIAPVNAIARWDGQVWSSMAGGLAFPPTAIAAGANGDVIACAINVRSRFDGTSWQPLVLPGVVNVIQSLVALPNGDYAFGGVFQIVGTPAITGLALYSNGTLSAFPGSPGMVSVQRLFLDSRGGLVAGGQTLKRWDGSTWTTLAGSGFGFAIGELANGELVVSTGEFGLGGAPASRLARLRSTGWESFGEVRGGVVSSIASGSDGRLSVGGAFTTAAGLTATGFTSANATCPAATAIVGAGCTGGAGAVVLTSPNGAWVVGLFRATATGMTANSLALQLVGLPAAASALPGGAPGCSLFTAPLFTDVVLTASGEANVAWEVPNNVALVGQQPRLQVVGVELDPTGTSIVRLTSSNALQLTIGAL